MTIPKEKLTGVQMAVEVDHGNRPVRAVDGPQQRQGDGVVTAHRDDARKRLAFLREADLVRIGGRVARENAVVALLDLVESPGVVVSASF